MKNAIAAALLANAKAALDVTNTPELLKKLGINPAPQKPPKNTVFAGYLCGRSDRIPGRGRRLTVSRNEKDAIFPATRRGPNTGNPIAVFRYVWPSNDKRSKRNAGQARLATSGR